jgi:glucokinase
MGLIEMTDKAGCALGIDIGGTTTKVALVTAGGQVAQLVTLPTPPQAKPEEFVPGLLDEVREMLGQASIQGLTAAGIGIALAGFLDKERTQLVYNPNLAFLEGYPLRRAFVERFNLPVLLEVDSNAATLGEYHFGSGRGAQRFLCLAIGTGLGGGVIIDDQLLRFSYQCVGDMGHVIVQPGGPRCACGCQGCAEALVSAYAIERQVQHILASNQATALNSVFQKKGSVEVRDVIDAARQGDAVAITILAETGRWFGIALASLAPIFLPDRIAVAGGVSEAEELLLEPTERSFHAATGPFYHQDVAIRKAQLGWQATVIGAASPLLVPKGNNDVQNTV